MARPRVNGAAITVARATPIATLEVPTGLLAGPTKVAAVVVLMAREGRGGLGPIVHRLDPGHGLALLHKGERGPEAFGTEGGAEDMDSGKDDMGTHQPVALLVLQEGGEEGGDDGLEIGHGTAKLGAPAPSIQFQEEVCPYLKPDVKAMKPVREVAIGRVVIEGRASRDAPSQSRVERGEAHLGKVLGPHGEEEVEHQRGGCHGGLVRPHGGRGVDASREKGLPHNIHGHGEGVGG